jgi:acetyl-CoA C-acetyltransferase
MSTDDVFIVSAKRTPVGKFQGGLSTLAAPALGSIAVRAAVAAAGVDPTRVGAVLMGQVLAAGSGQAPARQAALGAGLPVGTRCTTVSKVCGSGLQSVILGWGEIRLGNEDIVVAGGQECMSRAPYLLSDARAGLRLGHKEILDSMIHDGLWDPYGNKHMGSCAEECAKKYGFTRELQDEFAKQSYTRALAAYDNKRFAAELVAVETKTGKQVITVAEDEEFRGANFEKMASLRPAFEADGTITAANASKINDGAAALVLASGAACAKYGLKPLARIVAAGAHAQEPNWFTTAPVSAMRQAAERAKIRMADVDLFEINEAFANVTMAAVRELELDPARVNVHGGAIALGHPIGASGARILTTLVHALHARGKKSGMAGICIGGGEALALLVERV